MFNIYRCGKFILAPEIKQVLGAFILAIKYFLAATMCHDPSEERCC